MNDKNDSEKIAQLAREARAQRGGKPTKYVHLDQYSEIAKLVAADVQLPFILKWLADEKKEVIALNTLRKYVIFKIGRPAYEDYLKRNGWLKTKRGPKPASPETNNPQNENANKNPASPDLMDGTKTEEKPEVLTPRTPETQAAPIIEKKDIKQSVGKPITAQEKTKSATVDQLKEVTRGHFDPNQFNDDSE